MSNLNFCAIDFETMTPARTSACAIGMVEVRDNVIMRKFYSLIKPIPDDYEQTNTFVNAISHEMCKDAPTWEELYSVVNDFLRTGFIVCHNADFDIDVFVKLKRYYKLEFNPDIRIIDTKALFGGSLENCCEQAGIEMECHHDALSDAMACAELILAKNGTMPSKPRNVKHPSVPSESFREQRHIDSETKVPLPDEEVLNMDTPFFHRKVVITGVFESYPEREKLAELLRKYGADINGNISKKTNIVLKGDGFGTSKMKKIEELQAQGVDIRVYDETQLIALLNEYHIVIANKC